MAPRLEFDVLVMGGGPAGSACATVLAGGGARVGVVEADDFGRFRIGETISPAARAPLARLGFVNDGAGWGLPSAGVSSVWGRDTAELRPSLANPYGRGWRVDRQRFDQTLFEHAGVMGASLFPNSRVNYAHFKDGWWEFAITSQGGTTLGRAAFVVEATGRTGASRFAPRGARRWVDRLVGVAVLGQSCDPARQSAARPQASLVEAVPCGWWYSVYLPCGRPLAVFFTDGDLLPRGRTEIGPFLEEQFRRTDLSRDHCRLAAGELARSQWRAFDARTGIRRTVATPKWMAVGDAQMAFDPLSGLGVTHALDSGIEAAAWLLTRSNSESGGGLPSWAERAAIRFDKSLQARLWTYCCESRWQGELFWQRRLTQPTSSAP